VTGPHVAHRSSVITSRRRRRGHRPVPERRRHLGERPVAERVRQLLGPFPSEVPRVVREVEAPVRVLASEQTAREHKQDASLLAPALREHSE